jgi:anthranilate phosphoribosyltransferase
MIKEAIVKIVNKGDLTYDEALRRDERDHERRDLPHAERSLSRGSLHQERPAETTDEIAGCAAAMRTHATRVETGMELFEIVGTGGDNAGSFNISTTAALVAAAGA